jgi:hypothetical protein
MPAPHTAGNPATIEANFPSPAGYGSLEGTTATVTVTNPLGVVATVDDPVVTINAGSVDVVAIWNIPDASPQGAYLAKIETEGPIEAYSEEWFYVRAQTSVS